MGPVFDALYGSDRSGRSWIDSLIGLGDRTEAVFGALPGRALVADHGRRWGDVEQALPAPLGLLQHLIQTVTVDAVRKSSSTGETLAKRLRLARRDPPALQEALTAIDRGERGRRWFVLEGPSYPDALLETDDYVVCIEGKRTERGCTDRTTWMPVRVQLLRHMDAALDQFRGKRIVGLLIVEGSAPRPTVPSDHWLVESRAQYEPGRVSASLPHRSDAERRRLAAGIVGVTTWQAVCERLRLPWPPYPEAPER